MERSAVTFVAVALLLDPFFLSSWRFFLSSSLVLRRSSFRSFFLSICFSVKRTRRLGRTLGAMWAKRLCPYFAANKIVASKRIARNTRRKRDGIVHYAQEEQPQLGGRYAFAQKVRIWHVLRWFGDERGVDEEAHRALIEETFNFSSELRVNVELTCKSNQLFGLLAYLGS